MVTISTKKRTSLLWVSRKLPCLCFSASRHSPAGGSLPPYPRVFLSRGGFFFCLCLLPCCRDWFQLTLKEGLTVFRDQLFTADMCSAAVKRIEDVTFVRSRQFAEDSGPMAHPIRPESYIAMDNFYTATVYDKGAEVIRM